MLFRCKLLIPGTIRSHSARVAWPLFGFGGPIGVEGRESALPVVPKKRVDAVLQWLYTGIMPATTEPLDEKTRVVSLRIPPILALRMVTAVLDRKRDYPKFSMNDWIIEAMREKLDGPPEGVLVTKETMRVGHNENP